MEREFGKIKRRSILRGRSMPRRANRRLRRNRSLSSSTAIISSSRGTSLKARRRQARLGARAAHGYSVKLLRLYEGKACTGVRWLPGAPGNPGSREDYHNINVAFTKDGETGGTYIERLADEIEKNYSVRVVTSDNLIRLSALRSGALRCSSGEFKNEVEWVLGQIDAVLKKATRARIKQG